MSNRFAWSCKLADLGFPVILVYLGFLDAHEMGDRGKRFATHNEWGAARAGPQRPLFPGEVWDREWSLHGQPFIPIIRSLRLSLSANPATSGT
ncbi:MAG: hypothetical protein M5U12_17505 [Verrucomicrobia bacterium]|nr:hypothetical protein [Verrucomicrobiota bacterium]